MMSVLKNVIACSVLMLASVAVNATTDHWAFEAVAAHANLTATLDSMASTEDEQADSSDDAETMLA